MTALERRLGLGDATLIVMGGIVGSGIFINPYVVAQQVHTPFLILLAWVIGALMALGGAFIYAELAARYPATGGQYVYLREAFHPAVAFTYGLALLLVTQTGGMAAVAITFARYFVELTGLRAPDWLVAAITLAALTVINCLGVRAGSNVQNLLMVLKTLAIAALVAFGFLLARGAEGAWSGPLLGQEVSFNLFTAIGASLIPVFFAYGGWQTASFVSGEMKDAARDLPRGLLLGVAGVAVIYLAVNVVCLRTLGPAGLASTTTPASTVMRLALGGPGATFIALGIAISTLGFLSQGMLTAPRVYYSMAADGLFFRSVARLSPSTRVPMVAIALQGALAIVIAISGRYEQILNYVVSVDFIWFGLTGCALFAFRRRAPQSPGFRAPGHPLTTALFVAVCWLVVLSTIYKYPGNSAIGLAVVALGFPLYKGWKWLTA